MVDGWLTLTQAAKRIGVTPAALRQAIKRGRLDARKVGPRMWLVSETAIDDYNKSKWQDGPRNAEWWAKRRSHQEVE